MHYQIGFTVDPISFVCSIGTPFFRFRCQCKAELPEVFDFPLCSFLFFCQNVIQRLSPGCISAKAWYDLRFFQVIGEQGFVFGQQVQLL
ncbi:MAG: hypothetical protein MRJ52_05805 [Nitrosomonas sp.]|nr:hypothetical protein [Nitrosomonas sp.]